MTLKKAKSLSAFRSEFGRKPRRGLFRRSREPEPPPPRAPPARQAPACLPAPVPDENVLVDLIDEALDETAGRVGEVVRWSDPIAIGKHLRLQAAGGHRAAILELRPGLHLIAELPERATRPEFGFVPLLAPLMVRSAARALRRREEEAEEPPELGWADRNEIAEIGCRRCK